jgi:hypothetical protein
MLLKRELTDGPNKAGFLYYPLQLSTKIETTDKRAEFNKYRE